MAREGILYRNAFWQAFFLADNENGFVIVIPDAPWLSDELLKSIEFYSDTRPQAQQVPAITRRASSTQIRSPAPLAPIAPPGQTVAAGQVQLPQPSLNPT